MSEHVGVVVADRGAAIVGIERADDGALLVVGIERLTADISAVIARLGDLGDEVYVTVDADGLGSALWTALSRSDDARWRLYSGRGVERQQLVDRLLVAIHEDRFRFAPALGEQEAMSKALVSYRRQVREDGLIGGELVVALLLALIPLPEPPPETLARWGRHPFAPPDEVDGVKVGNVRLRRGPHGGLVGIVESPTDD